MYVVVAGLSASAESVKPSVLVRRSSSKDKDRRSNRGSGRRNKENGRDKQQSGTSAATAESNSGAASGVTRSNNPLTEQDCTEMDVQTIHVTLTYKPRI